MSVVRLTDVGRPDTTQASNQVNSGGTAGPTPDRTDPSRLGRRIGVASFWLLACYVIGMSSISIIPSLFFPQVGPRPRAPSLAFCASEIAALDQALVEITTRSLRGRQLAELGRGLHNWDGRAVALSGGCGALDQARQDLLQLRTDVEALIRKIDRGPRKTQERIHRALQQIKQRAAAVQSQS